MLLALLASCTTGIGSRRRGGRRNLEVIGAFARHVRAEGREGRSLIQGSRCSRQRPGTTGVSLKERCAGLSKGVNSERGSWDPRMKLTMFE